jgi:hypothetical protein
MELGQYLGIMTESFPELMKNLDSLIQDAP